MRSNSVELDSDTVNALSEFEYSFVLSDPRKLDHPIVFASDGFLRMTEYTADEVIGKNCRFLQGPETDRRMVLEIREAIREERTCHVKILNYTKSRKPFWNLFYLSPIYSRENGQVVYFAGVQTPITSTETSPNIEADDKLSLPIIPISEKEERLSNSEQTGHSNEKSANHAIQSVVNNLVQASHDRFSSRRSMDLETSSKAGLVCSSLLIPLVKIQQSFVLADPILPDTPIVHASERFCQMSGYSREEVLGRNCRFLQGPETDPSTVQQIRECITAEKSCTVRILNYRKNGSRFWNSLHIAPVRNCQGKVAFFCGVQLDVSFVDEIDSRVNRTKQLSTIGAVKVAVRALHGQGLRQAHCSSTNGSE